MIELPKLGSYPWKAHVNWAKNGITENIHWIINPDLQPDIILFYFHILTIDNQSILVKSQDDHILIRLKNTFQVWKLSFWKKLSTSNQSTLRTLFSQRVVIMIHRPRDRRYRPIFMHTILSVVFFTGVLIKSLWFVCSLHNLWTIFLFDGFCN